MRYRVTCNPAQGHKAIWRGGRHWPSGGVLAETVDEQEESVRDGTNDEPTNRFVHLSDIVEKSGDETVTVRRIGRRELKAMEDDGRFSFMPADGSAVKTTELISENERLKAEIEALKAAAPAEAGGHHKGKGKGGKE